MGRSRRSSYERLRSENYNIGELVDHEQDKIKNNPTTITLGGRRRSSNNLVELWKKMEGKAKLGRLPLKRFIATYEAMMLCFAHKFVFPQQW
uniref:Uncharacterized protein n=1 Tax=Cucumis melo TaxID=3656 RepID=A0A9I9E790_CUCME